MHLHPSTPTDRLDEDARALATRYEPYMHALTAAALARVEISPADARADDVRSLAGLCLSAAARDHDRASELAFAGRYRRLFRARLADHFRGEAARLEAERRAGERAARAAGPADDGADADAESFGRRLRYAPRNARKLAECRFERGMTLAKAAREVGVTYHQASELMRVLKETTPGPASDPRP